MKKLFSALFIVMMIALACTMVASATDFEAVDGLYTVEYATETTDGTQFGMVVIEATGDEAFALNEATIRYIDQAGAANGKVAFDAFAPMDLKNNGTYKVYIGGGELDAATLLGTLKVAAPEPTPEVTAVAIDQAATSLVEGETLQLSATVTKVGEPTYTLAWASDNSAVATVDAATGLVTAVKAGEANITVTAAEGITATVKITVTAPAPARVPGNANDDKDGKITVADAAIICRYLAGHTVNINFSNANVNASKDAAGNDTITVADAALICRYLAGHAVVLK